MQNKQRLTYSNVVSTLALFLALGGGAAYAAGKIHSDDIAGKAVKSANIAPGAVRTAKISKRAITSGKLAVGAVRSNQIGDGVVSSRQIGAGAVAPSNLEFPVFYVASPSGGSAPVTGEPAPYAIAGDTWTQNPGQIEVIFGPLPRRLPTTARGRAPAGCFSRSPSTASRSAAAKSRPNRPRRRASNRASAPSRRSTPSRLSPTT